MLDNAAVLSIGVAVNITELPGESEPDGSKKSVEFIATTFPVAL